MNMKKLLFVLLIFGIVAASAFAQNRLQTGIFESSAPGRVALIYIGSPDANGFRNVVFMDGNEEEVFRGRALANSRGHKFVEVGRRYAQQHIEFVNSTTLRFQGRTFRLLQFR